jgi:hypothetical protein
MTIKTASDFAAAIKTKNAQQLGKTKNMPYEIKDQENVTKHSQNSFPSNGESLQTSYHPQIKFE